MPKNKLTQIHESAKRNAIKKVQGELKKQKEFQKLKKLNELIKNGSL